MCGSDDGGGGRGGASFSPGCSRGGQDGHGGWGGADPLVILVIIRRHQGVDAVLSGERIKFFFFSRGGKNFLLKGGGGGM